MANLGECFDFVESCCCFCEYAWFKTKQIIMSNKIFFIPDYFCDKASISLLNSLSFSK